MDFAYWPLNVGPKPGGSDDEPPGSVFATGSRSQQTGHEQPGFLTYDSTAFRCGEALCHIWAQAAYVSRGTSVLQ